MGEIEPTLISKEDRAGTRLVLAGNWTARHARRLEELVDKASASASAVLDLGAISRLDTFGAWSIETMRQRGRTVAKTEVAQLDRVPPEDLGIVTQVQRVWCETRAPEPARHRLTDPLEATGRASVGLFADTLALFSTFGAILFSVGHVIARPGQLRWRSVLHHLDSMGVRAVPIVTMMTFLIGCIIAQQGFFHFRRFGATDYVVDLVTILVLREIGVLLVTITIAGRSGSACAAELGSMKMREEVDALRTMGLDPVDVLILPRVLALVFSLPMLAFLGMLAAMLGAGLVAATYGEMSPAVFLARFREAYSNTDLAVGLIKAPIMALVIGTVASLQGLRVEGSAASLGAHTTASVVETIFLVIVLDGFFAMFFAAVGM